MLKKIAILFLFISLSGCSQESNKEKESSGTQKKYWSNADSDYEDEYNRCQEDLREQTAKADQLESELEDTEESYQSRIEELEYENDQLRDIIYDLEYELDNNY